MYKIQRSALRSGTAPSPAPPAPMVYPQPMAQNTMMGWPTQSQPAPSWEQPVMMQRALPPPPALLQVRSGEIYVT